MMIRHFYGIAALLFPIFFGACSLRSWTAEDEHFVTVYTEILLLREQYPDTTIANPKVRSLLEQNGYSELQFQKTYSLYAANPERLRQLLDTARTRVQVIGAQKSAPLPAAPAPAETR